MCQIPQGFSDADRKGQWEEKRESSEEKKKKEKKREKAPRCRGGGCSERIVGTEIVPSSSANVRTPKDRSTSLRFLDRASARARRCARNEEHDAIWPGNVGDFTLG